MPMHLTPRLRKLMGLPEPEEPYVPPANLPPPCCSKAIAARCTCEAAEWRCPDHGTRGQRCNALSHD